MIDARVYAEYNGDNMTKRSKTKNQTDDQSTVRVKKPTPDQAAVLKALSPEEKLQAMIEAAKKKVKEAR